SGFPAGRDRHCWAWAQPSFAGRKIDQNITMGIACHRRIRWHHHRALVLLDDQWPATRRLAEAASGHDRCRQHTPGRTEIGHALAVDARRAGIESRYPARAIGRQAADETQVHDLVRVLPRKAMAIASLMLGIEAPRQLPARGVIESPIGKRDRDLKCLPGIAQISESLIADFACRPAQASGNDGGQAPIYLLHLLRRQSVECAQTDATLVELEIGEQEAKRAEHSCRRRHYDAADAQLAGERGGMHAAQTAKGEHDEVASVAATIG